MAYPHVFIALPVRNAAYLLPFFLPMLEQQDYPAEHIDLFFITNDNTDNTLQLLEAWIEEHGDDYHSCQVMDLTFKDDFQSHNWDRKHLSRIATIRNLTIDKFLEGDAKYYFTVDVDNFLLPETLTALISTNKDWVAPLITMYPLDYQSNFFADINYCGRYAESDFYYPILHRHIKGTIAVPLIHCVYLLSRRALELRPSYGDGSEYEFIYFANSCRERGIQPYILNEKLYGFTVSRPLSIEEEIAVIQDKLPNFIKYPPIDIPLDLVEEPIEIAEA